MKALNLFLTIILAPSLIFANVELIAGCPIPVSQSEHSAFTEILPQPPETPTVLPPEIIKTTETAVGVVNALGVVTFMPQTQISQGARSIIVGRLLSCHDSDNEDEPEQPSWTDSPTQLSIGDVNNTLAPRAGTVVGNWILFGGISAIWGGLAKYYGPEETGFPGGLSLPALFLLTPTTSAGLSLAHEGEPGEQALGICSMLAQAGGSALVAAAMHPRFFGATWLDALDPGVWGDKAGHEGFVKRDGALFAEYRGGRYAFVLVELAMSTALGVLDSLKASKSHCTATLAAAAGVTSTYAIALLALKPHREFKEHVFLSTIAVTQAAALTTQAIASAVASEETQDKIRPWTQIVVLAGDWALFLKGLYDLANKAHKLWKRVHDHFAPVQDRSTVSVQGIDTSLLKLGSEIDAEELRQILGIPNPDSRSSSIDPDNAVKQFASEPTSTPPPPSSSSSHSSTPQDPGLTGVGCAHRSGGFKNPFE